MKKIMVLLVLSLFFVSCSRGEEDETVEETLEKTDFFVETSLGKTFWGNSVLKKVGQVQSSQDIEINANANGRVSKIYVEKGQSVSSGKNLALLEDTLWNFDINIQRSNNAIQRAQINYESQEIALDKQIFDAKIQIENLERSLNTLKKDSEKNILLAEDSVKNSQDEGNIEKLDLQIDKLELQKDKLDIQREKFDLQIDNLKNNIEKSRFDYDLRLKSDQQAIESYGSTLRSQYNTLIIALDDIIEFSDEILWVTFLNRNENDAFEDYLWANDSTQKAATEQKLIALIAYRESEAFKNIESNINAWNFSQEDISEIIADIEVGYTDTKDLLSSLEKTLNNSIKSVGSLGDSEIAAFINAINGYQSQVQGNFSAFLSFESWVNTFFESYRDNQASILKNINLQEQDIIVLETDRGSLDADTIGIEKDIRLLQTDRDILQRNLVSWEFSAETGLERTQISIDDNIASLETQISSAKNTLLNAQKNKTVTLKSLQNAIDDARIWLNSSSKDLDKLKVESPIAGSIQEVLVDIGQEVFSGTPLFRILSDTTPEIEVSFSADEKKLVKKWQKVSLKIDGQNLEGTIANISDIADENLNHKATISLKKGTNIIGNLVSVEIPVETNKMLIPLNIITTQWWEIGIVKTLSGSSFQDVRVRMWEVFWNTVEIVSCAKNCVDLNIITSDVSNFDENKFTIIEK